MEHVERVFEIAPSISIQNHVKNDELLPHDWESFHSFPKTKGWVLDHDYNLELSEEAKHNFKHSGNKNNGKVALLAHFLQSWLFFGLIRTVVQENGKPLLDYDELAPGDGGYLTTKPLAKAIEKWNDWETHNRNGIQLRMIRTEKVLDIARRTIRKRFSCEGELADAFASSDDKLHVSDELVLSLMTLGEALSAAKVDIMRRTNSELRGWHSDDDSGWGQPRYVLQRMRKWCPRTVHIWRSQFRSNATLLLAAYSAYQGEEIFKSHKHFERQGKNPNACDKHNCYVISSDQEGAYQTAHSFKCDGKCGDPYGPNMQLVRQHLKDGDIPLLQFKEPSGNVDLVVSALVPAKPQNYTTISHVWSDGFGNEKDNKLHRCQLEFIRRQLDNLGDWNLPFWMDSLVVPVQQDDEAKKLRKKAITQIFDVFKGSMYTLVMDAGLSSMSPRRGAKDTAAHAAMRILASSWMRRLWTLQEAFLSQKIYFAFREGEPGRGANDQIHHLQDFAKVSKNLESSTKATTAILSTLNEHMRHNVMGHEWKTRDTYLFKASDSLPDRKAAVLVANAWKAARWRVRQSPHHAISFADIFNKTTTNDFHETLALATLLDLDYSNTDIAESGLRQVNKSTEKVSKDHLEHKDHLMAEFWRLFNERWPHAIPPGIIFLPGDRIDRQGYGWAPRTWMSANSTDPPDPLSFMNSTAELDTDVDHGLNGLKVRYPGFLLHAQDRDIVLSTDKHLRKFWFPTGPSFLDWYAVEAEDTEQPFLEDIRKSTKQLAIITSRPKPANMPAEVGLLVQIREERAGVSNSSRISCPPASEIMSQHVQTVMAHGDSNVGGDNLNFRSSADEGEREFFCEIIHRVKISQEARDDFRFTNHSAVFWDAPHLSRDSTDPDAPDTHQNSDLPQIPKIMVNTELDSKICIAEELAPYQVWYVDGYFQKRGDNTEPTAGQLTESNGTIMESVGKLFAMFQKGAKTNPRMDGLRDLRFGPLQRRPTVEPTSNTPRPGPNGFSPPPRTKTTPVQAVKSWFS